MNIKNAQNNEGNRRIEGKVIVIMKSNLDKITSEMGKIIIKN